MTEPAAPPKPVVARSTWKQHFDPTAALERLDGDEELLGMLVAVFQQDHVELSQQLTAALQAGDFRTAERSAHSLKGLASNFDALEATQAAQLVEQLARNADAAALAEPVRLLGERLEALRRALAEWEAERA